MKEQFKIARGTYDILPDVSYKWEQIVKQYREMMKLYNYREIVTPIFESSGVFERTSGKSSDIVKKEMYKFKDKKEREYALRPEGTAPVVRSYIENDLKGKGYNKLYYIGPMFRYDRPQKGRYRQFYQYGLENLGSNNPITDADTIAIGYRFLMKMGIKKFKIELNCIGNKDENIKYNIALKSFLENKKTELCNDCKERLEINPKRILDCKNDKCREITKESPSILNYLEKESNNHFELVKKYLDIMKIEYKVNDRIVRGLDYYNSTAFEFIYEGLGAQDTILAGGRYNGLVEELGGENVPGIGFAGGIERLLLCIENENIVINDDYRRSVYVAVIGEKEKALNLINCLRDNNITVDYDFEKNSFKALIKDAVRNKSKWVLIIGEDEIRDNYYTVKNMDENTQIQVNTSEIDKLIKMLD